MVVTSINPTPLNPLGNVLPMMVHVTAPASLPAGYTFEAAINDDESKIISVEVPDGGVEEGQIFLTPLPDTYVGSRLAAPTGRWKDEMTDCCKLGMWHPSLWCSLCCTQLAMAQIIARMQLTWLGQPGTFYASSHAFMAIALLVIAYFVYCCALELAALPYAWDSTPPYMAALRLIGNVLFVAWSVYALCRTRQNVRTRYQIPEGNRCPRGWEDLCCAVWCSCCAAAQMLRHTGEYEHYPGICCSKTGHPPGTPLVV